MKAHISVDSWTRLTQSVAATAANMHNSHPLPDLQHRREKHVWGESTYSGRTERAREHAPGARNFSPKKASRFWPLSTVEHASNWIKSITRAKVVHPFLILKRVFGFTTVHYFYHGPLPRTLDKCQLVVRGLWSG